MRIILVACVIAVLLAVGAGLILSITQKPIYEAQSLPGVRVGDPGYNLVGPDWSGLNRANETNTKMSRGGN